MNNKIKALNNTTTPGADASDITGKTAGTYRGLHTYSLGSSNASIYPIISMILGTLPDPNFNEIRRTVNSETSETYAFLYCDIYEFEINITDPNGDFIVTITDFSPVGLEQGGWLLTEAGDILELG